MDVAAIRQDFPTLHLTVNDHPLVYLDNGATSQKPRQVIEAMERYYREENANVHRGAHTLGERATTAYENAREKVRRFINARDTREIIFTRNASEAINLVASSWGMANLQPGDAILTTIFEHHSNLVPWQAVAKARGCELRYWPMLPDGNLDMSALPDLMRGVRLVAVTLASNVLGTIPDIPAIIREAHRAGAVVVGDGAQYVPQAPTDVQALDIDFLALTGHKMLGPTGIGALYGKRHHLEKMEPYQFGGSMISAVELTFSTWAELPEKFEAGTPNIAGAVGLGAAIDYLTAIGMENIRAHEQRIGLLAKQALDGVEGVTTYGPENRRAGLVAFNIGEIHPHDVSAVFDSVGVAIRAGHHCAQPLHYQWLKVPASNRASFYLYNTEDEIEALVEAAAKARDFFHAVK
jgi:cysteine desulfurase / selenocysteine lyase